jgi:hypothetical protein
MNKVIGVIWLICCALNSVSAANYFSAGITTRGLVYIAIAVMNLFLAYTYITKN